MCFQDSEAVLNAYRHGAGPPGRQLSAGFGYIGQMEKVEGLDYTHPIALAPRARGCDCRWVPFQSKFIKKNF